MPTPPKDPGYFDKVNYVIDSWSSACEAPWYIYIETMKPAALTAFITLITFGWDDVYRGYARPKGLGGRRTGKRKGKWRRAIPKFPELGELIGKNLPLAEEVQGRKWSCFGKTLWRIDTVIQRGLFWWLVADVTIDFAYDWTSLLYETEWCKESDKGRFSFRNDPGTTFFGGGWRTQTFPTKDYEKVPPDWQVSQGVSGPTGCKVAFCMDTQMVSFPPKSASWSMRLMNPLTGEVYQDDGPSDASLDPDSQCVTFVHLGPNKLFRVQVKTDADFLITSNCAITAVAN